MKIETSLTALALATLSLTAAAPAQSAGYVSINPVELHGSHVATYDGTCHSCSVHVPFVGYRTFSQQAWGKHHGEAASLRDRYFHRAFPYGLTIGDARIAPGPTFGIQYTSSHAVDCFLPNEYDKTSLHLSAVDPAGPVYGSGGAFAGRLIAAKLNTEFDRIGVLGLSPHVTLGEMIVVGGVDHDLRGYSVDHIIEIADQTIAGVFGHLNSDYDMRRCCVDVNGDGYADVSADDIFDALRTINKSFRDGCEDRGHLAVPHCNACTSVKVYKPAPIVYTKPHHYGTCSVHGSYGYGSPCAYGKCATPPNHGTIVVHADKYGHNHKKPYNHGKHVSVSVGLGHVSVGASKSYSKSHASKLGKTHYKAPSKKTVKTKAAKSPVYTSSKTKSSANAAVKKRARLNNVAPRRVFKAVKNTAKTAKVTKR